MVEAAGRLGIARAPEHDLVQNPKGGKSRLKRLHCTYCHN
jgi:hypothetical protein